MSPTAPQASPASPADSAPLSQNPDLIAAEEALKTGHFAAARVLLQKPIQPGDEAHRKALLWRLSPDPFVAMLIAGCLIFFAYVALTTQH
ncbi:MAG TPA: hypothetical protein PKI03_20330 [Pseudomonadota bacterium]|nr:hypothetical protein [Pseudomonadota bacterium]